LDEATVILQTNIASQSQTEATIQHVGGYGVLRESTHDLVADPAPPSAQLGDEAFIRKVINQHNTALR